MEVIKAVCENLNLVKEKSPLVHHITNYVTVNDCANMVLAINEEGLHIGQKDVPLKVARKLLGPDKIIGVSASTVELAFRAEEEGADYLGLGAVYATATKDDAEVVEHTEVQRIREAVKIPIAAIGGINEDNAGEIMKTGVDGICVISAILGKEDVRKVA